MYISVSMYVYKRVIKVEVVMQYPVTQSKVMPFDFIYSSACMCECVRVYTCGYV